MRNRELYSGQLIFVSEMKHVRTEDGKLVPWNLLSIPCHRDPKSKLSYIVLMIHSVTLAEHRGLAGLHTARARRADRTMRAQTWGWENASIGPSNFIEPVHMDYYPFTFEKDASPTSILLKGDLELVMEFWTRNVLQKLHDLAGVKIAFLSVATESLISGRIFGGTKQIQAYHKKTATNTCRRPHMS
jgi:hypothetical protein